MIFKKIFAYGSLMNEEDLKRTVPEAKNIIPAKLSGYTRVFNLASHYRFDSELDNIPVCVLTLERTSNSNFVNGICFDMEKTSFDDLLERERTYDLVESVVEHYELAESYQAYFFISKEHEQYPYILNSNLQHSYLELCISGCLKYGSQYLEDFKKSTHFFNITDSDCERLIWSKFQ